MKADMGTIVHKTLEVLAALKKYAQDNPNAEILTTDDDAIGKFSCDRSTILEPYTLSTAEVDKTNKTRINKQIYKSPCLITYGHTRYGVETVHRIFDLTYAFYRVRFGHHNWTSLAERDMLNWTWMALDYLDGICDPRKRTIVEPEQRFDFTIDADWARYKYGDIEGQLSLKGTIDLITQVDDDTYEIIDWKTGQRLDWSTGEVKTPEKLQKDPQLMLYYYAAKRLYPDKEIILTINFIRDGGPFSICFDEETIPKMEGLLKKQFLAVQKCRLPKLLDDKQRDFRCQKLCHYYKNNWPGTNQNMCRFIRNETLTKGIDKVIQLHKHKDHAFDKYNAPGGV